MATTNLPARRWCAAVAAGLAGLQAVLGSRQLQSPAACPCQQCLDNGLDQSTCEGFGLDCSCLLLCGCQGCLDSGVALDTCISWGLDCAGCQPACGVGCDDTCVDDPSWTPVGHPTWTCATFGAGGINNAGGSGPNPLCNDPTWSDALGRSLLPPYCNSRLPLLLDTSIPLAHYRGLLLRRSSLVRKPFKRCGLQTSEFHNDVLRILLFLSP